jgi:hypothetical protein
MLTACQSDSGGTLDVAVTPRLVPADGTTARVKVTATTSRGTLGQGTAQLKAAVGVVGETRLTLDSFGTASTTYACDVATEAACTGRIAITATWVNGGVTVEGGDSVTVGDQGTGGGSNAGGGTGAGAGSGVTPVTNQCSPASPRPGFGGCCRPATGTGAGPMVCPAARVEPGGVAHIPFVSPDGRARTTVNLRFSAPSAVATLSDCNSATPKLETLDGGTVGNLVYLCSNFAILADGAWQLTSSGGCQSQAGLFEICDDLFSSSNPGAAHTMVHAQIFVDGQWYDQDNTITYFFVIHR